jgi:chromosome segregation ATPase
MTQDKALKTAIRARMAESGEPYNVARRAVMADDEAAEAPRPDSAARTSPGGPEAPGDATVSREAEPAVGEQHPDEDYYARYEREAELSGARPGKLRAMKLADRLQGAADRAQNAADYAEDLASQAEDAADEADEEADEADDAASTATEWASAAEMQQAERRAELMRERAGRAREKAERARERAEQAQEQAEQAQEAADQAFEDAEEDEDDEESEPEWHGRPPGGSRGRPPVPPHPARPPRPPHPPRPDAGNGIDRLMGRLDELEQRFAEAQDRAAMFLNRFIKDNGDSD